MTSPAATTADDAAADADAVVVRLGSGRFAVSLASVAEVGRMPSVTRVPGTPGWVAGVANWRGRILPILDLRSLLGATEVPLGTSARLLVLSGDGVSVGLLVEAVEGTAVVAASADPFPATLSGSAAQLLAGQLPQPDGPVAVLDVDAVLRMRESLPRGRRSA
ncbi:MAG TPA: chemotaxis protein CheW [Mycobacteriales bacterium]|nr:chemotaxis protein CheW [Mycobacteriales bacterium]